MPKIIGLRQKLDEMLRTIRTTRNINARFFTCPKCGLRAHGAEPRVTVRALIFALGRFEITSQAEAKALEKLWKQYRAANQLDMMGDPLDSVNLIYSHNEVAKHSVATLTLGSVDQPLARRQSANAKDRRRLTK
jgi:hypothetical protein